MMQPSRSYYSAPIEDFLTHTCEEVLGALCLRHEFALEERQRNAWTAEISILKRNLNSLHGHILLEYSIPRMGKRADAVLLFRRLIAVLEFKVGDDTYASHGIDQVFDYALDLKNFHKDSHNKLIAPILIATEAAPQVVSISHCPDGVIRPILASAQNLQSVLQELEDQLQGPEIDPGVWLQASYSPTPTIIEAAQALYRGHGVTEISRSEAGASNLTETAQEITNIIEQTKRHHSKSIIFVTGVPGAGKTLAGLNIANSWHDSDSDEHAVFLSGNGPLVDVLREALARDEVSRASELGIRTTKSRALSKARAFIQNIHHFRDDALITNAPPIESVVVFDEAQRAWDLKQTSGFMKSKKGIFDFDKSEPEFLISVMDRQQDWATIICLVGGGQEINTGEAGLVEWFRALESCFPHWRVFISNETSDTEYSDEHLRTTLDRMMNVERCNALHLATSIRSFRSDQVSSFVQALLDNKTNHASEVLKLVSCTYPIVLTRDVEAARQWLRSQARGTERFGIVASSEAQRLRPFGINVKADVDPKNWFLNNRADIRSSFYMEDVATEFQIQGLELDWTCIAWDADLRHNGKEWEHFCFRGTRWQLIKNIDNRKYLKNAYRVLLTRARQGMVIFIPCGSASDHTRKQEFYDPTYQVLRDIGIPEIFS